ncbi:MAG: hypothetical protein ACTSRK_07810 [Promethearchaeota archaeon]
MTLHIKDRFFLNITKDKIANKPMIIGWSNLGITIIGHCDLPKKFGNYYGNLESIRRIQMEFLDTVKNAVW